MTQWCSLWLQMHAYSSQLLILGYFCYPHTETPHPVPVRRKCGASNFHNYKSDRVVSWLPEQSPQIALQHPGYLINFYFETGIM